MQMCTCASEQLNRGRTNSCGGTQSQTDQGAIYKIPKGEKNIGKNNNNGGLLPFFS